jgi:hypothetical protein
MRFKNPVAIPVGRACAPDLHRSGEKEVQSRSRAEERRGLSRRSARYANCTRIGTADRNGNVVA